MLWPSKLGTPLDVSEKKAWLVCCDGELPAGSISVLWQEIKESETVEELVIAAG